MVDQVDNVETLERKSEGEKSVSEGARDEVHAGSEQQTKDVKDYYEARKNGMRDKQTREIFGAQPEFYDSTLKRDDKERVTDITYPNGKETHVKYDDQGNTKSVQLEKDKTWEKEGDGKWTQYNEKREKTGEFNGDITVSKEGDVAAVSADGKDVHLRRPDGSEAQLNADKSQVITDSKDRVTDVVYPDGSKSSVKYDDKDNPTEVKLGPDRTWKKDGDHWDRYDSKGKKVGTFDGDIMVSEDGDITARAKDGSSTHVKHPDGSETDIDSDNSQTSVDKDGKLISVTRANGHTAKMEYDSQGKLKEMQLPDKTFKKEDGTWNEYDKDGNKKGKFDGDFAVTKDGDVTVKNPDKSSETYHRDGSTTNVGADKSKVKTGPGGEVTEVTYPSGQSNKIQYDNDGFPKQIDYSNGTQLVRDGDHWAQYKNGKKVADVDAQVEVRDDGSIVTVDSKGNRTTTNRNGSVERSNK